MAVHLDLTDEEAELLYLVVHDFIDGVDEAKLCTMQDRDMSVSMEEMLDAVDNLDQTKQLCNNILTGLQA